MVTGIQAFVRKSLPSVWLLAALVLPMGVSVGAEPDKSSNKQLKVRLWVPAYFYPSGKGLREWERMTKSGWRAPIVAIVNPASGPGQKIDPNYVAVTTKAREGGLTLIGYVASRYTKTPLEKAKTEVDAWLRFYPKIQGIFVDEQTSEAAKVDYYAALYRHIRSRIPHALVLSNPGTECDSVYLSKPAADAVCLFELDKGFEDYRPPAWTKQVSSSQFGIMVYNVKAADKMRAFVQAAIRHRAGYIYITDATGENPYDRLPSYWEEEVEEVRRINEAK